MQSFDIASSSLTESRTLEERVVRKYLLPTGRLDLLLRLLHPEHLLLPAGDAAWARYENVYFDSAARDLYHAHRRSLRPRHKVRIRHYLDRRVTFLEVKRKERSGRTVKFRQTLPFGQGDLGSNEHRFIEAHASLDSRSLVASVTISFQRLTLLGRAVNERVTIDRDLMVVAGGQAAPVPPVIIAEVKQLRFSNHEGAVPILRGIQGREAALSEYLPRHTSVGAGQGERLPAGTAHARADFCMHTRTPVAFPL